MGVALVAKLPVGELANVPAMLRKLADQCEREATGMAVVVTLTSQIGAVEANVYGFGKQADLYRARAALERGIGALEDMIEAALVEDLQP